MGPLGFLFTVLFSASWFLIISLFKALSSQNDRTQNRKWDSSFTIYLPPALLLVEFQPALTTDMRWGEGGYLCISFTCVHTSSWTTESWLWLYSLVEMLHIHVVWGWRLLRLMNAVLKDSDGTWAADTWPFRDVRVTYICLVVPCASEEWSLGVVSCISMMVLHALSHHS